MSASYLGPSARLLRPKVFVWDNEEVLKVHLCSAGAFRGLRILLVLECAA